MPFTLLTILLAFAAPMGLAELPTSFEDEAVVELCRSGRAARHRIPSLSRPTPPAPTPPPFRSPAPELPSLAPADWTPTLFSRPPPL